MKQRTLAMGNEFERCSKKTRRADRKSTRPEMGAALSNRQIIR